MTLKYHIVEEFTSLCPNSVNITFIVEVESKDKTHSVVKNVSRALLKKKVIMLGSR